MKEIEILVEVLESKEGALQKLRDRFEEKCIQKIHDIYFYDPEKDKIEPGGESILDRSFRLRSKDGKGILTYKIKKYDDNGKWLYSDEHEVEVSSHSEARKIIEHLGLKPLVEINNERNVFVDGKYEIVLEAVRELGLFLEVETLSEGDVDVDKINKEIMSFILSLGIKIGKELNYGKPELLLLKNK